MGKWVEYIEPFVGQGNIARFSVAHQPIVKEYAQHMGLVDKIDGTLNCGMHTGPGKIVLSLIMNTLCGRSPIYRIEEFFKMRDVPLLFGNGMTAEMFNDDAIGELQEKAGYFVLLTSVPAEKKSSLEILKTYKEQDGIEKNFDPSVKSKNIQIYITT